MPVPPTRRATPTVGRPGATDRCSRERGRSMCTARTGFTGAPTSSQGHQVRARRCCCEGGVPTQGADVMIRRAGARLWRSGRATCAAPWRSMPARRHQRPPRPGTALAGCPSARSARHPSGRDLCRHRQSLAVRRHTAYLRSQRTPMIASRTWPAAGYPPRPMPEPPEQLERLLVNVDRVAPRTS